MKARFKGGQNYIHVFVMDTTKDPEFLHADNRLSYCKELQTDQYLCK